MTWNFFIDVGGTFTDVVARRPDGTVVTHKLLSSGAVRGVVGAGSTKQVLIDERRVADPPGFWVNAELVFPDQRGDSSTFYTVAHSESRDGALTLDRPLPETPIEGTPYELRSGFQAPVLAIRYLMGLAPEEPVGSVDVFLGTTMATNALLERKGARVAFITTKGFGDLLKIGYQDRPHLFKLQIKKRDELFDKVVEIDERMNAEGAILRAPDEREIRGRLEGVRSQGIDALAIVFLHAHVNPTHEEMVATIAEEVGFAHVSVSSRVARLERIVPRGDTTVVDAYLGRVIQDFVTAIRLALPESRVSLMTSYGGIIAAETVKGKDTILSGPAGGVVGCARVIQAAGFTKAIGFDMGGTSTDVSRIDPPPYPFEYQHETVKAGVRLVTPMLAIETVAAGGGSICSFDGQMLTVGPESAGADPGPACYGRGGPLTVTDMNVFLGRIVPDLFPFRLDVEAVRSRLEVLADTIAQSTTKRLSSNELADGFVQIANANMASAIKRISVAKGYDVRDYVLASFGGAGGQHACAIARMLGMSRIHISPFAGVLSAVGIGVADIKRIEERSTRCPLDAATEATLGPVTCEMTERLRDELVAQGMGSDQLGPARTTWDMCYRGQSTLVTVDAAPADAARRAFEESHRRLYGYVHENRDVEIRVIRVELAATRDRAVSFDTSPANVVPPDRDVTLMVVAGCETQVPVLTRSNWGNATRIVGPAVIVENTSTIVVDEGWTAETLPGGDLLLSDLHIQPERERKSTEVDPIRLELFNNQFTAIAQQMGATLRRTALSTNVKERLDYSCAIFTASGDLVVNAPHIPVHLGGMSDCIKCLMEDVGEFASGDVLITNDPYRGGSHLNDVTVVTPVYDTAGEHLLFFVASRAHHAEIGGRSPGSMPPDSQSLAEEGVLIRAFRWVRDGHPQIEEMRRILTAPPFPSRTPDDNLADMAAQVAANQTGVRSLHALSQSHGMEVVLSYMQHIQAAAERKMRAALRDLPDGVHRFEDRLDDGSAICVAITIESDRATIDFSGTAGVLPGNLNANRSIVTSAVLYCLRCLIDEDIPLNAGVLAPIEIVLPECLLNPKGSDDPRKCPAVVGGNVETSQRIVDCIFGALGIVAASQGTMNNLLIGNERFGYYETICGGSGAGPDFHGADAVHTHMTNTRMTDPEVLESRYPVRLCRFAIRKNSGGKGRYRGGDGVVRELEFLQPLELSILSQRRATSPYGMAGGCPGRPGRNRLYRKGAAEPIELPSITCIGVEPGDRLVIETPGGGGYGDPAGRIEGK